MVPFPSRSQNPEQQRKNKNNLAIQYGLFSMGVVVNNIQSIAVFFIEILLMQ